MIDKSTLIYFFENELNSFISNFLFRDKHLLHEGKFKEFAQITIKRIQQSFGFLIFTALCFVFIGVFYLLKMLIPESSPWVGLAYIFNGVTILFISTKEYYKIRGSLTLLLVLLREEPQTSKSKDLKINHGQ